MKKIKPVIAAIIILALAAGIAAVHLYAQNWTKRYSQELDNFFGEGNWVCIDEETKESIIYSDQIIVCSNPALSGEDPGKYRNWYIKFDNRNEKEEIWYITNHTMKINHDEYWLLSPKRYSGKQALTQELMDVSFGMAADEVTENIIKAKLTEEQQKNVLSSFGPIKRRFCDIYGKAASFWIYFDEEHKAEYRNGKEIDE